MSAEGAFTGISGARDDGITVEVLKRTAPQLDLPPSRRVSRRRGDDRLLDPAAAEAAGEPEEDGRTVDDLMATWQSRRLVMLRAMRANARSAFRPSVRMCGLWPRIDLTDGEPPLLLTRVRGRDRVVRNLITIGGLHRCGSVWTCPWCAFVSAIRRREELEELTEGWIQDAGGAVLFLTLTMRHSALDPLATLWDGLQAAWSAVRNARVWDGLQRHGMPGWVRVTEITFGRPESGGHGWHVHLHCLLFLDRPLLTDDALNDLPPAATGRARRAGRLMTLESVRQRIYAAWSAKLKAMNRTPPLFRRWKGRGEWSYPGVDLRPVLSRAWLRSYFDKGGVLDPTWSIADEVAAGATMKVPRREDEVERLTPLGLLRAFAEDWNPARGAWFFDLPRAKRDSRGRRADRRTWFSPMIGSAFELHLDAGLTEADDLAGIRVEHDAATGEVTRLVVEVPPEHRAWFEFQAGSRTLPREGRGPGTRSQTWRQVRGVRRGIAEKRRATAAWLGLLPILRDGEDDGEDVQAAEYGLGGTPIGGFTRAGWERYLGLPVEDQAELHAAFERSAASGLRAAERMHVEVRLSPEAELEAAYRTDPV